MPRQTTDSEADAIELEGEQPDVDELRSLVDQLDTESPLIATVLDTLVEMVDDLQTHLGELEEQQAETHDIAKTAVGDTATNEQRLDEIDQRASETRNIARAAVAKAEQATADPDEQEDVERLPADVEPSSSPLDFFANCRPAKVKEVFVEQRNRTNTYRAIAVAKRWEEFATIHNSGDIVAFEREDLTNALTAELGTKPHRQTVRRVWKKLIDLGGIDLERRERRVSNRQEPTEMLRMDRETAEGLLEERYVALDLLDGTTETTAAGGVTPVVTEGDE